MSKGSPSMVALLGLLAVAGYQNRDKLSALLRGGGGDAANAGVGRAGGGLSGFGMSGRSLNADRLSDDTLHLDTNDAPASGGLIADLRGLLQGGAAGAAGGGLLSGLSDLLDRFTNPVQSAKARSWVDTGPNGALEPGDLDEVLDPDTVAELVQKTGLSRAELMKRLSTALPDAVDQLTPKGRLPTPDEARAFY